ncbi:DNA polymerase III subunit epsilon [Corynebacterium poyangense]|uniref:DNA polymerase III subunit epsilon n=1 Tax=Corynebacterium poyangense TaxID=2684405 RepID=A0A7H0SPQ5_9CORY|nr:exonuclease domain-containing protein [Corynebacterium poyangense]MBZ8178116.1 DNA polymerase III subunit epsilon [Corynebacterium poyangense]QNQ90530.1 DNA polymerase III subunit epsilon [Corynebacterium poyangense]
MISAQGAELSVDTQEVRVHYSPLYAALYGPDLRFPVSEITSVDLRSPTSRLPGVVTIERESRDTLQITFAPQQHTEAEAFIHALSDARSGHTPAGVSHPVRSSWKNLTFCAIDVETLNAELGSICQLGLAIVRNGQVVETYSWLCQPPEQVADPDPRMVAIHGISSEALVNQPPFSKVLSEALRHCEDLPLVAHHADFDIAHVIAAAKASNVDVPDIHFGCSLILARNSELPLRHFTLAALCDYFGIHISDPHHAEADARACAELVLALAQHCAQFSGDNPAPQWDLPGLFRFRNLLLGIYTADTIYPVLADRFDRAGQDPSADSRAIAQPMDDAGGAGTDFRSSQQTHPQAATSSARPAQPRWARVAQPETIPDPNPEADPHNPLYSQVVTLSGDFSPFDKGELWQKIADCGATIAKNVTKKTTLLVAGPWDRKTSKQKRAEELQAKGQEIDIWDAQQLYHALGLVDPKDGEQPPF